MLLVMSIALMSNLAGRPAADVAWPVHIVDSARHPGGRSPFAVVGSLFTGGHCYREDDGNRVHVTPADEVVMPARLKANKYSPVMEEYLLGNLRPRPGCDEEETCVFLTSPPLENGQDFTVDAVRFDGRVWSVSASVWCDEGVPRGGPGPSREGQMLRLGWLKPGEYACRFTLSRRVAPAGTPRPGVYTLTDVMVGATTFTVGKGDPWAFHPWDQAPTAAVVKHDDLEPCKFEAGPPLQPLYYAARREVVSPDLPQPSGVKRLEDRMPTEEFFVTPALDWKKYGQKSATLWERPAGPPASGVLTARFTGGGRQVMGRYDWAEVTAVEWFDREDPPRVRVHAAIWRRPYMHGNRGELALPAFAVPLASRGLGSPVDLAERLKLEVVWSEGEDNPRGAVEEVRH
jgi:hypothetical protein